MRKYIENYLKYAGEKNQTVETLHDLIVCTAYYLRRIFPFVPIEYVIGTDLSRLGGDLSAEIGRKHDALTFSLGSCGDLNDYPKIAPGKMHELALSLINEGIFTGIWLTPGWKNSENCKKEYQAALDKGLQIKPDISPKQHHLVYVKNHWVGW